MSNTKWIDVGHYKNSRLRMALCYFDYGGQNISVQMVIPLWDLRDTNYDGTVGYYESGKDSVTRWIPGAGLVFSKADMSSMAMAQLYSSLYKQLMAPPRVGRDPDLYQKARQLAVGTAFRMGAKAFASSIVGKIGGSALQTLLRASGVGTIYSYLIKETATKAMTKLLGVSDL